jgi:hypothetical protein
MHRTKIVRRLAMPAATLALIAACGGGDKSPTGPGGGGNQYDLVSLGNAGLPADAELEDCTVTRFYSGGLRLNPDGTWRIGLEVHDQNDGDWGSMDERQYEVAGTAVWLESRYSGATYQGTIDGGEVAIMYDCCYNGVPDVQLVFDR